MAEKREKKIIDPQDNKLQLSNKRQPRTYITVAKVFLKKFGTVELNALGEATQMAVRIAENL